MKFKQFLLTERRSKPISQEEAFNLLEKNCKQALKSTPIYRGVKFVDDYFLSVNPSDFERKSANTKNYYTLLIDNSPYWKDYPKRSKSIICTTSHYRASAYGNIYRVFPYDGAKIGICPASDFWGSFINSLYGDYLDDFNENIEYLFSILNIPLKDNSISSIKKSFKQFDKVYQTKKENTIEHITNLHINWLYDFYSYKKGLLNYINEILNPKKNNLKLQKIGTPIKCDNCEVWTDSKSILIQSDIFNELKDRYEI